MKQISTVAELKETFFLLEIKQKEDFQILKKQFVYTVESLKPSVLIKNTISELTEMPDLKSNLLNTAISLAMGFLSKKIIVGSTHNPIKQIAGTLLQTVVTNMVSKNTNGLTSLIFGLISKVLPKKE